MCIKKHQHSLKVPSIWMILRKVWQFLSLSKKIQVTNAYHIFVWYLPFTEIPGCICCGKKLYQKVSDQKDRCLAFSKPKMSKFKDCQICQHWRIYMDGSWWMQVGMSIFPIMRICVDENCCRFWRRTFLLSTLIMVTAHITLKINRRQAFPCRYIL